MKKVKNDAVDINLLMAIKGKLSNSIQDRVMTKEEREDKKYHKIISEMNTRLHVLHPYFEVISQHVQAAVHQKNLKRNNTTGRKSSGARSRSNSKSPSSRRSSLGVDKIMKEIESA